MTRKPVKILVGLLVLLGITLGSFYGVLLYRWHKDPYRNTAKVSQGMSERDVQTVLGPPGDYRTHDVDYVPACYPPGQDPFEKKLAAGEIYVRSWKCDGGYITIYFDREQNRVTDVVSIPADSQPRPFWKRFW